MKIKKAICCNCNGILQNNIETCDAWFHIDNDAQKNCKIKGGLPVNIYEEEHDSTHNRIVVDIADCVVEHTRNNLNEPIVDREN